MPYDTGDIIGVGLDFDKCTVEFFKNRVSQGIAFNNLRCKQMYPAVSLTPDGARVRLLKHVHPKYAIDMMNIRREQTERQDRWKEIMDATMLEYELKCFRETGVNRWDPSFTLARDMNVFFPPNTNIEPSSDFSNPRKESRTSCMTFVNEGCLDQWRCFRTIGKYSKGINFFEVEVLEDCITTNSWRICVGGVPTYWNKYGKNDRCWIGSERSWSYISGTGGKCYNMGQSSAYGDCWGHGDRIAVLMNFENMSVEFFKNGESQGIAFEVLEGPVYGAASVTGQGTSLRILTSGYETMMKYKERALEKLHKVASVKVKFGNIWDTAKLSSDAVVMDDQITVENRGGKNTCCTAASLVSYSTGRRYFEMEIVRTHKPSSSWKVSIGVITKGFNFKNVKPELGCNNSWSYVSRSGGKCHNKLQSYSQRYGVGDRIGCLIDFENEVLEFYKNGKSCGEAFTNVTGPVFAACTIKGLGIQVRLNGKVEEKLANSLVLYS